LKSLPTAYTPMKKLLSCLIFTLLASTVSHAGGPKLLVDQDRIDAIAQAVQVSGSTHQQAFAAMQAEVDANGAFIIGGGDRISSIWNYGRSFLAMRASLLYAITGDESYAQMAYDALWAVHNDPDPSNRLPNEGYGLARATVGTGFAIAFDLAGSGWSQEQRDYIRFRIVQALNAWESFSHANLTPSHQGSNWVAVCRGAELLMMLSVDEQVNRAARFNSLKGWLNTHLSNYGTRGYGQEGNYYVPYSLRFLIPAAVALRNIGDTTLESALVGQRDLHHIAMFGGMFNAAQSSIQWGVGGDGFGAEGFTSLLLGIVPPEQLPYYTWFYDRYRGLLNPAPAAQKFDSNAGGDVYALLFYPESLTAQDPAGFFPKGIEDNKGGYYFRSGWQDANDLIVSLGADTSSHGNAWDEADALQLNILGFGTKFTGGPASSGLPDQFNQVLVNGQARASAGATGTREFFQIDGQQGYAIAGGGNKYTGLGVNSAYRHLLVDFREDGADWAVISTLDDLQSTSTHAYTWQLNTQGLPAFSSVEGGVPTFTVEGSDGVYLKGWILGPSGVSVETGRSVRASVNAANMRMWVVMAVGKGAAPEAEITGSGLQAQVRLGDRVLSFDGGANRIVSTPAEAWPMPAFSAVPTGGIVPLAVAFDASASSAGTGGGSLSYHWDFGDGHTATGVAASHTFQAPGTFTARLTVTNASGQSGTATRLIHVGNTPPNAAFSVSTDRGDLPLQVDFDGSLSFDPDGHSLTYEWDFGDGHSGSGQQVSHTYTTQGVFYPVLTVHDGFGGSAIAVQQIFAGNQPPVAVMSATPESGLPPLLVNFSAAGSTDPESDPLSYHWDFGDGHSATGLNASHTYTDYGHYTVTLTVSDDQGNSTQATRLIRVENRPPSASFTMSASSGNAPATVHFDASASSDPEGEPLTYHWDFGDGAMASGATVSHTFTVEGNYEVTLTVTDPRGASGVSVRSFSALDALGRRAADQPEGISQGIFYEYFTGLTDHRFPQFDQMTPSFSGVVPNINHRMRTAEFGYAFRFSGYIWVPESGTYTFHYTARDTIYLRIGSIEVLDRRSRSMGSPNSGTGSVALQAGLHPITVEHHFYEKVWNDWFGIFNLSWSIPGSPSLPRAIPDEYLFHRPVRPVGVVRVSPSARDYIVPETVNFINPTQPGVYEFFAPAAGQPLELFFDGLASYSPVSEVVDYLWEFPGGDTASGASALRQFTPGTHPVTLTVTDASGARVRTGVVIQILNPPSRLNRAREHGRVITAGGESGIGPAENAFDGRTDTRWLVWAEESWIGLQFNHNNNRQAYVIDEYSVTNPAAWNDRDPLEILFRASNDGVNWVVLDHQQNLDWGGQTRHTKYFPIPNTEAYSQYRWDIVPTAESPQGWIVEVPQIEIFDSGSGNQPVNRPPVADFEASTPVALTGVPVSFDASASFDPDNYPLAYFWQFGDGHTARSYNPIVEHRFFEPGIYTVQLTVRDSLGSLHSTTREVEIQAVSATPPVAAFSKTPERLDNPGIVQLDASASTDPNGETLTFLWELGDGSKAEGAQVAHLYPSGVFTVTLTVVNESGLRDVTFKTLEVLPVDLQSSIGINFASSPEQGRFLFPSEYAGAVPARNWNSMGQGSTSMSQLRDSRGDVTPVTVTTNASARYILPIVSGDDPNDRLISVVGGHLSQGKIDTTIRHIPYPLYDVYVYWGGGTRDGGTTEVLSVSDGNQTRYMRGREGEWDGLLSESTATSAASAIGGNEYVVFRGKMGSEVIITTRWDGSRNGPSAIQIVDRSDSVSDPIALFNLTPASGIAPLSVNFDASQSFAMGSIVEYRWDWEGNGEIDQITTSPVTHHVFTVGGLYMVQLTVVDEEGRTGSTTRQLSVDPPLTAPVAVISASTLSGETPLLVHFDASGSYDQDGGYIVDYLWDWNSNGTIDATGVTASHTFTEGSHNVRLTVVDNDGEIGTTTVVIQVSAPLQSTVFSVNFGANEMGPEVVAGVVTVGNWNNLSGGVLNNLRDASGHETAASISHQGTLYNYNTDDDPSLSGDHRMMSTSRGSLGASFSVDVSGLPAAFGSGTYDVIVYFGGHRDETFLPRYSIGSTQYVIRDAQTTWDGVHRRSTATTSAAAQQGHNYVRFEGISGTSFTLNVDQNNGARRYGISGLQIVLNESEPEPPPYLAWLAAQGLEESSDTAPGASWLQDGVPNVLKYLAGVPLSEALPSAFRPTIDWEADADGRSLVFSFRVMADRSDVLWVVEQSVDLEEWTPVDAHTTASIPHEDGSITHRIRSATAPADGVLFMRLTMEIP
jgi:PKD repeat protein